MFHVPAPGIGAVKSFTSIAAGPVIVPAVTVNNEGENEDEVTPAGLHASTTVTV
jgi:hypothetical protein